MITLSATDSLSGVAGTASAVTYTLYGDKLTTSDAFQVLAQGQLPSSTGTVYPATASTQTLVKSIHLANTTGSQVTGIKFYVNGTAGTNQILGSIAIPSNGTAVYANGIWQIYDSVGSLATGVIGATGPAGSGGSAGATGATGPVGGSISIGYIFSTTTADSDPGNGNLRLSNGTQNASTVIRADLLDSGSTDWSTVLNTFADSTNTVKGHIRLFKTNDITKWLTFTVSAVASPSGYKNITVANVGSSSASPFANSDPITLTFERAGDMGATGPSVSLAAVGASPNANAATITGSVLNLQPSSASFPGVITAAQHTKLNNLVTGMNGWIDVTQTGTYVANAMGTGETATNNTSYLNAIIAAAPSGSVIFFPGGFYNLNGAITVGAKALRFQGGFSGVSGGLSALVWTANVGGNLISLTDGNWYTQFRDLTFLNNGTSQSAGAVINVGSNAFTNVIDCTFSALSGTLKDCINYTGTNSGIISVVRYCSFTGFSGVGIYQGGNLGTIIVTECTMNGAQVTSTVGIQVRIGGAMIISDCDIIGCNNNLLIDPLVGTVVASVYVNNTYFDSSQGSCIKITGAGATVRCKFTNSQFTTAASASPNNAVEVSSTFNYGNLGMGLDFVNCNVLNTFASGGTPSGTGFNITGAADFTIMNCNTALWTVGIDITSATANAMTQPMVMGNSIGPCGGYGANTTGLRLNNGSFQYGPIKITQNVVQGNTNDITNSITTNAPVLPNEMDIRDNLGTGKNLYEARNTNTQTVAVSTLVDIAGVSFPIVKPSMNYLFDGVVNVVRGTTTNTAGIGIGINAPAGATIDAYAQGPLSSAATVGFRNTYFTAINASQTGFITTTGITGQIRISGVIKAGTATSHTGTVQVRLSNNSHTATIFQGSWIRAAKVD